MQIVKGKSTKKKATAKSLADPDAIVPGIPDHVERPETDHPVQPVAVSRKQIRKNGKRIAKAAKRRLAQPHQ